MNSENDEAFQNRMATAKRELLERVSQDQKAHLIKAEQVLRDVVFPAFAAHEEADRYNLFVWRTSPERSTVTFANGIKTLGNIGAQLELTRSNDPTSRVTLRIVYVQDPYPWFEVFFIPGEARGFSVGFDETTTSFVSEKIGELVKLAHGV